MAWYDDLLKHTSDIRRGLDALEAIAAAAIPGAAPIVAGVHAVEDALLNTTQPDPAPVKTDPAPSQASPASDPAPLAAGQVPPDKAGDAPTDRTYVVMLPTGEEMHRGTLPDCEAWCAANIKHGGFSIEPVA